MKRARKHAPDLGLLPYWGVVFLIALVIIACPEAKAQLSLTLTPMPLAGTQAIFGKGRQAGLWTVGICPDAPGVFAVPRERILAAVPGLAILPNQLARDVFLRRAASDRRFTAGNTFRALWKLAPGGLTAGGVATSTSWSTYAGIGLTAVPIIIDAITKGGPEPSPYLEKLMPDSIVLIDGGCQTWYLAAALIPNARTIQVRVPEFVRPNSPQTTPNNLSATPTSFEVQTDWLGRYDRFPAR